jgi:hypothetical protein
MASSLGRRRGTWGRSGIGELGIEEDGRTARPRDFPSRESHRVSRSLFKKLIDMPALTKMAVLLAKNKEMKIHTAAHIAASYTTGACPNSIARRLVKRFKVVVPGLSILRERIDGNKFIDDESSLPQETYIHLIKILNLIENVVEENIITRLIGLDSATFERIFNNSEILSSEVDWFCRALAVLSIMRPAFYRKIILDTS